MGGVSSRFKLFRTVGPLRSGVGIGTDRRTIHCSTTICEDVQKLAGTTLIRPLVIEGLDKEKTEDSPASKYDNKPATTSTEKFTPPPQLFM
ncbi:uncharacterized protein BJ212DRAFT_587285 [Suillus subaureus]|uniref:Uncharacterized protein n=1 Tax=Suillus subaureus TaxID=48587 RepID=A0A9P7E506_9AGAM|nr:uncharacterized protein BJ212DRAFT_587285 [Suillus subaureus]KAG1810649.1 hypothetical protein BJ212DRAFT_587285 [Suillus subaureus]